MIETNIYVALDAANDKKYYEEFKLLLRGSTEHYNIYDGLEYYKELDKNPDDEVKFKIQKNLERADIVIVLLTKTYKSMRKFSKWQLEHAINIGKPIIAVNPNKIRSVDYDVCPTILKTHLSIHVPYELKAIETAIKYWPDSHNIHMQDEKEQRKIYKYAASVYEQILIEEE